MNDPKDFEDVYRVMEALQEQYKALGDAISKAEKLFVAFPHGVLPKMINSREASEIMGISERTLMDRFIRPGKLPFLSVGSNGERKTRRFFIKDVYDLVESELSQ
jgi:hypothetical protein